MSLKNIRAMTNFEEDSERNVVVPGDPHQSYTEEASRKNFKTTVTFPDDFRVIHKTRNRFNNGLTVRKYQDARERKVKSP